MPMRAEHSRHTKHELSGSQLNDHGERREPEKGTHSALQSQFHSMSRYSNAARATDS